MLLVGALVVSSLAATGSPASAQDGDIPPGILPEGDWTPDQQAYLLDLVERAEEELPAFSDNGVRDEELLESLGFVNFGATAPGGWDHWINPGWFDDDHIIDPEYPESLVHRWDGEKWVLEAAMFFLRPGDTMEDIPEKYADIAWLPGWHAHPELCWDENFQSTGCSEGERILIPMMHVWIVDNPCGHRFAGVGVGGINCSDEHHHIPPLPDDLSEVCDDPELLADLKAVIPDFDFDAFCQDPEGNPPPPGLEGGQGQTPGTPAPAVPGSPGFTG